MKTLQEITNEVLGGQKVYYSQRNTDDKYQVIFKDSAWQLQDAKGKLSPFHNLSRMLEEGSFFQEGGRHKTPDDACLLPPSGVETFLRVGDIVTFTNKNGVSFSGIKVIGFTPAITLVDKCVYLDYDCWWFPASIASLTLTTKN